MPSSARTAGQGHASKALWSILNGLTGVDYAKEVYVSSLHEEYPNPSIQIATDAGPLILGLPLDESGAALLQLRHMKLRHPLVVPLTRAFLDLNNNKGSLYVDEYLCNLEQYIKRCSGMKCVTPIVIHPNGSKRSGTVAWWAMGIGGRRLTWPSGRVTRCWRERLRLRGCH